MTFLLLSSAAFAKADLVTTISDPVVDVDSVGTWQVTVDNIGNRNANSVSLLVQLPETATSPTVYVMGDLSYVDGSCAQSGTELVCNLGRLRKGRSATIEFDIALPQKEGDLEFYADVATTSREDSTSNNDDLVVATVLYPDEVITGPVDVYNEHCSGQGLTSFYECEVSPGSISSHEATLEADGSISFTYAGYGGSWAQASDSELWFEYTYSGGVVAEFFGDAVGDGCFEGLTTFPGSAYVSPYAVCLQ